MTFVAIAFNLLGNAMLSFGIALLLTYGFVAALRIGPSYGRALLWLVPFAKLGYDIVRGIPGDSFLWLSVHGTRQDLGTFMLGFGVEAPFLPSIQAKLASNVGAFRYPQSAADLLHRGLSLWVSPAVPAVLVTGLLGFAAFRLLRRLVALATFVRQSRGWLAHANLLGERQSGQRRVRVLTSAGYEGTPFAAGLLRPYVLLPERAFAALSPAARDAVIAHELAHLRRHDPALLLLLGVISDVFWFVPGMAAALRQITRDLELSADALALRAGATRAGLVSALVTLADGHAEPAPAAGLFGKRPGLLRERVERMLEAPEPVARWPYRHLASRSVVLALFVLFVIRSFFFGNS
jgi:beta-lactamase regulating signal transducer with metallopeptidase domain